MSKRKRKRREVGAPAVEPTKPTAVDPPLPPIPLAPPPSKLTEEITQAICDAVGRGLHKYHIAGSVGIDRVTLYRWLERGEAAEPGDEPFVAFATRFKKAQADFCQARFGTILEASEKTWTAAAWILERLYPDEYSDPGKELARLRNKVAELEKLVPEVQGGDDNQALLARAAAIILANEPPEDEPEGLGIAGGPVQELAALDAEAGAAGDSVPE